jgi:hypothetical protein
MPGRPLPQIYERNKDDDRAGVSVWVVLLPASARFAEFMVTNYRLERPRIILRQVIRRRASRVNRRPASAGITAWGRARRQSA